MKIFSALTPIAIEGSAPPPPERDPGCGRPWGGNSGRGGGDIAKIAAAATVCAMVGPYSLITSLLISDDASAD